MNTNKIHEDAAIINGLDRDFRNVYVNAPAASAKLETAAGVANAAILEIAALEAELIELVNPKQWRLEKDREERNGIKRPSAGTVCAAVWEAIEAAGGKLTAKQQRELADSSSINFYTIRTQYQLCRKFNEAEAF